MLALGLRVDEGKGVFDGVGNGMSGTTASGAGVEVVLGLSERAGSECVFGDGDDGTDRVAVAVAITGTAGTRLGLAIIALSALSLAGRLLRRNELTSGDIAVDSTSSC